MRIGVVSDTHGHLANTRKAVAALATQKVELILHCGDIGSPEIPPLFNRWPTHFVFGNCDYDTALLDAAIKSAGQSSHGAFGSLTLADRQIALIHSHDHRLFRETIAGQEYDLVCYGHTHVVEHHYEGRTLLLNPGALYRADPHTIAVVELPELAVTQIEIV